MNFIEIDGKRIELSAETVLNFKKQFGIKESKYADMDCEEYWFANNEGGVGHASVYNNMTVTNHNRISNNLAFTTEQYAQDYKERTNLMAKLQRFADENNDVIDWEDEKQFKFYIFISYITKELMTSWVSSNREMHTIYFSSQELSEAAIEKFKPELLKYFGVK